MAGTVSASNITNITQAETGDSSNWDDIGGGPGSGQDANNPIEGSEDRSRRIDNVVRGFSYDSTTASTLSSRHVGFWVFVAQPNLINSNGVELLLGDAATPQSGNWNGYFYDESSYPTKQGWVRIWLDPSRTRDTGAGTLNLSTGSRQWGCEFDMGDVGGTTPNCHLDRIDTCNSNGLSLTAGTGGSPATFSDLVSADEGTSTARYGIWSQVDGVTFVSGPTVVGGTTATVFADSGFNIVFSSQELASSSWMTLTFSAGNTASDIALSGGSIASGGSTNLGQVVFSASSAPTASLTVDGTAFARIGAVTMAYGAELTSCSFSNCGAITFTSGSSPTYLDACRIVDSTAASAVVTPYPNTSTNLPRCAFVSSGTGHAIELSSGTAQNYTLQDVTFDGYASSDGSTGNEAVWVRATSGTVNITINGGDTPSIRTDGATVNVINSVTVTVTTLDEDLTAVSSARVLLEASGAGPLPVAESVSITRSGSTATVSHTAHGVPDGEKVVMRGSDQPEYNGIHVVTVTGVNSYTFTVSGTPTTPATGTITSTGVILEGTTNGSGVLSRSDFPYSSDQPCVGRARKSTSSPFYRPGPLSGTVTSSGLSTTTFMGGDGT